MSLIGKQICLSLGNSSKVKVKNLKKKNCVAIMEFIKSKGLFILILEVEKFKVIKAS